MPIKTILKQSNNQPYRFHITGRALKVLKRLAESPGDELVDIPGTVISDLTGENGLVRWEHKERQYMTYFTESYPTYYLTKFGAFILALAENRVFVTMEE